MGRRDLTSLLFSKVVKYWKSRETYLLTWKIRRVHESTVRSAENNVTTLVLYLENRLDSLLNRFTIIKSTQGLC